MEGEAREPISGPGRRGEAGEIADKSSLPLTSKSRSLAGFCRHLPRGAWLLASYSDGFSLFLFLGYCFDLRYQRQSGLFRLAMVTMVQRLDARSFFFRSQLSVCSFLALFFKVFRNRLNCHGLQCGRTISVQAVQFWPLRDNVTCTRGNGVVCATLNSLSL